MAEQELKVLLIEDNPGDAFLIKFYLGESTSPVFQVSHAETVKAAHELLAQNKYDLILSDMNLPDSFGVDTIKSILKNFPGNLVIVLTGLTDEEVGLETVRYGAQDFLVKGKFDSKVLISTVMFAFERFKLNKQLAQVSQQLNEENFRLDSIQRLLKVGYVEFDKKTNTYFRSGFALELIGDDGGKNEISLEEALNISENPEGLKAVIKDILEKGGRGEFEYTRKNDPNKYRMTYEGSNGRFCGVIQKLA